MPKLSELFDSSKPGSVKLQTLILPNIKWFKPYFVAIGACYGVDDKGLPVMINAQTECNVYEEPKPKTILYEWMFNYAYDQWRISDLLMTEEQAAENYKNTEYRKTGRSFEV